MTTQLFILKHSLALFNALLITTSILLSPESYAKLTISSEVWGQHNGQDIVRYTLANNKGMQVQVSNWGAYVTSIQVPDRRKNSKEVTLGYNSADEYVKDCCYSGATVGRYANRIYHGAFSIDDKSYQLTTNNGKSDIKNHLHGGFKGLNKFLWLAKVIHNGVEMTINSPDGDQGYPGNLKVKALFQLTDNNELSITYKATTTEATPVNLVSHIYFNLSGDFSENIESHELSINASKIVEVQTELIPTGRLVNVKESVFDLTVPHKLSHKLHTKNEQMLLAGGLDKHNGGFDHTWVLNNSNDAQLSLPDALLYEPKTGIVLEVYTTQPGMHVYTGNFMNASNIGRDGNPFIFRNGIALEAQNFADAPNQIGFPNSILEPGNVYDQTTIYKFGVLEN